MRLPITSAAEICMLTLRPATSWISVRVFVELGAVLDRLVALLAR